MVLSHRNVLLNTLKSLDIFKSMYGNHNPDDGYTEVWLVEYVVGDYGYEVNVDVHNLVANGLAVKKNGEHRAVHWLQDCEHLH